MPIFREHAPRLKGVRLAIECSGLPSTQENTSADYVDEILPGAPDTEQARTHAYALKQGGTAKQCFAPAMKPGAKFFYSSLYKIRRGQI